MDHPEPDVLLGLERADADTDAEEVRRHLALCAQCTAELESIARLDSAADLIGPALDPGGLIAPASSVWDRVQAELFPHSPTVATTSTVPRRSRLPLMVAAAAAIAGIVVGSVGSYFLFVDTPTSTDRTTAETAVPIAVGTLAAEGQGAVSGEVAMRQGTVSRLLTITFSFTVPGPGYVEAWLLDPLTNEMLGLGVLGPEGGTVTVPAGVDLSRFTTVDVSREPFDGDPAHSADSIARGVLQQL